MKIVMEDDENLILGARFLIVLSLLRRCTLKCQLLLSFWRNATNKRRQNARAYPS